MRRSDEGYAHPRPVRRPLSAAHHILPGDTLPRAPRASVDDRLEDVIDELYEEERAA